MAGINGFNPRSMTPKVNLGEVGKTDKNNAVGKAQNMQAGETSIQPVDVGEVLNIVTITDHGDGTHTYTTDHHDDDIVVYVGNGEATLIHDQVRHDAGEMIIAGLGDGNTYTGGKKND